MEDRFDIPPRHNGVRARHIGFAVAVALGALAAAAGLLSVTSTYRDASGVISRTSAELATLPPSEAKRRADDLTLWALEQVYRAFEEQEEGKIYDALSAATAGPALEALYLQRREALLDRGLEKSGQQVHELELLSTSAQREGDRILVFANWRVLGLVGHQQHRHVRGNAYTAELEFDRVEGRWRITGFAMREVDRTEAGLVVEPPKETGGEAAEAVDR